MKMRRFCLLLALMLCAALAVTVAAASEPQLYCVTDMAGLLTPDEDLELEEMAQQLGEQYDVGVYIVTVDDFRDTGESSVYKATYTIYHEFTMGLGPNRDGIMLLLSMAERDYAMFVYGKEAEYAFNGYGQEQLEEVFLDDFADDDWYGGFQDYLDECGDYLQKAESGHPVRASATKYIVISIALALIIALIVCGVLTGKMKSAVKQATADAYVAGGLNLTQNTDFFTHRTQTRTKIERGDSSSSSSSESGGGGSGRSGKF